MRALLLAAAVLSFIALGPAVAADAPKHRSFPTPDAAADALGAAYRSANRAEMAAVLGDKAMRIVSSGDRIIDRHERAWFLNLFEQGHAIEPESDSRANLLIGEDELPYPIPLVASGGRWRFDSSDGVEDLLSRRIGKTERIALDFLLQVVQGQRAHFAVAREPGNVHEYAGRFVGDPARRNGLIWIGADGKPQGPLAALGAAAFSEGYRAEDRLYHGYRFQPVQSQGPNAPGGAGAFVVDGRQTGGYGVVACPVRYAVSGVLSYMVNQDGLVYHRDLGPKTAKLCAAIKSFDPDRRWTKGVAG